MRRLPKQWAKYEADVYNLLKHNSDRSGPKLLEGWLEVFWNAEKLKTHQEAGDKRILWSNSIVITSERMDGGPAAHKI